MSRMAEVLGRRDDARTWRKRFEELRTDFTAAHVEDGRLTTPTQTACSLALRFDLLVDPAARAAAAADLVADVERRGHLVTGFVGTPHLLHALDLAGRVDLAYRLVEREEPPGWLHMVTQGATTVWERWDAWSPTTGFKDAMSSLNHYAHGSMAHWLHRTVGGIDVLEDGTGYRRILIAPRPGGSLTWARTTLRTPRGIAACAWRLNAGAMTLEATVPPSATALLRLPTRDPKTVAESGVPLSRAEGLGAPIVRDGAVWCELVAGTYRFEIAEPAL
jgi:alpha-L-rhamnosidase